MDFTILTAIIGVLIGLLAGLCSGMFGIGGGIVAVPMMRIILLMPGIMAVGTSIFMVIPTALSGVFVYARKKKIDVFTGAVCGLAGIPTVVLGAFAGNFIAGNTLMLMFSVLPIITGIKLLQKKRGLQASGRQKGKKHILLSLGIGAFAGFLSGLFGIGGGVLLVPVFVMLLDIEIHDAIGTSLMAIAIYGIPGAIAHALQGNTDFAILIPLLAGAVVGPQISARICLCTRTDRMRIVFAIFMFFMGVYMAIRELCMI